MINLDQAYSRGGFVALDAFDADSDAHEYVNIVHRDEHG